MCPFKADHDFILCTLGNKGELSQNLPTNATEIPQLACACDRTQIPKEKPDADIIFFDHQASDWEVPSNSLLLMPLKPARDQYATYIDAFKRAESIGKNIITVVTDGSGHRQSEKATVEYLEEQGAFIIPSSGVFSRASNEYRTIFDVALNKAYKVGERRREMSKILGALLIEQSETNHTKEDKKDAA